MSRYSKESFNKNIPVYVRKGFSGNGRDWISGQRFPWNKLAVDVRRVRLLFEGNYLTHVQPDDFETENDTEVQTAPDGESLKAGYRIRRIGGPWHDVISPQGEKVNERGLKKRDALALIEKLTFEKTETDESESTETIGDTQD